MTKNRRRMRRRNGEGTILYRQDRGSWYVLYHDLHGKRHQQAAKKMVELHHIEGIAVELLDHKTEGIGEARRVLEETMRHVQASVRLEESGPTNKVSLSTIRQSYLPALGTQVTPRHLVMVGKQLDTVIDRMNFVNVQDVTPERIEVYRVDRLKEKRRHPLWKIRDTGTISKSTVNHEVNALRSMLKWAAERNLVASNPIANVKPLKVQKKDKAKVRRALTPEEVERLLDPKNSPRGQDLIWAMFLGTGLRKNELSELLWTDIRFDHQPALLTVRSEISKNGEEDVLPLPDELTRRLVAHKQFVERRAKLLQQKLPQRMFTTRAGTNLYQNLLRNFYSCLKRAQIDPQGVDLHSLRKTYITDLIRQNVSVKVVQRLARHKTIQMTMDVYAEVFPKDLAEGIKCLSWLKGNAATPKKDTSTE